MGALPPSSCARLGALAHAFDPLSSQLSNALLLAPNGAPYPPTRPRRRSASARVVADVEPVQPRTPSWLQSMRDVKGFVPVLAALEMVAGIAIPVDAAVSGGRRRPHRRRGPRGRGVSPLIPPL